MLLTLWLTRIDWASHERDKWMKNYQTTQTHHDEWDMKRNRSHTTQAHMCCSYRTRSPCTYTRVLISENTNENINEWKLVYSVGPKREMNVKIINEICVHASACLPVCVCVACRTFWNVICVGNGVCDGGCDRGSWIVCKCWMNESSEHLKVSQCVIVNWSCATSSTVQVSMHETIEAPKIRNA